jgi:CheY-like chemotaxis protein
MELELTDVHLATAIGNALILVRERAGGRGIKLGSTLDERLGTIRADERKVKQILLNLLSNAIKFTPEGGRIEVRATPTHGGVEISVSDTGIGIAPEDQEAIFEEFQQVGTADKKVEGTGLGLALSRRFTELHGGRIWVTSRPGAGSTFAVALPLRHVPAAPPVRAPAQDEGSRPDTIAVIEDDRKSADLLRVYLEDAGFDVAMAADGVEGLELVRRLRPRAVILDVRLPRLDGWDVLAQLKADPATAKLPVVIVSMIDEKGRGFALGAAEYLVKPVQREQVVVALERCRRGDGQTVVVIDDDPTDLDLVEAVLSPEGYSVLRASGGEEGVALVAREHPAVVLVDLLMPGVDGFAVVHRLRSDPDTADVPIVVLTAKEMTSDDRARLTGQIDYLAQKGAFAREELVELVGHLCALRSEVEP